MRLLVYECSIASSSSYNFNIPSSSPLNIITLIYILLPITFFQVRLNAVIPLQFLWKRKIIQNQKKKKWKLITQTNVQYTNNARFHLTEKFVFEMYGPIRFNVFIQHDMTATESIFGKRGIELYA